MAGRYIFIRPWFDIVSLIPTPSPIRTYDANSGNHSGLEGVRSS